MKKNTLILVAILYFTSNIIAQNCNYFVDTESKTMICGDIVKLTSSFSKTSTLEHDTLGSINSVFSIDENTVYILRGSVVSKTIDGFSSWSSYWTGMSLSMSIFFSDVNTGYIVGQNDDESGGILKTTDAGMTWTEQTSGVTERLNSVFFIDSNTGYAVGGNGTIIKTNNGGANWIIQTSGTTRNLNSVYFTDVNTGYAVGGNFGGTTLSGIILKTTNGGTDWTIQDSTISTYPLTSVYIIDNYTGYIVGYGGKIFKTTNGGTDWIEQTSGVTQNLNSVFFIDSNNGYAVGVNSIILKTTNGGTNWIKQTTGTYSLRSVHFAGNTGFAGGYLTIVKIHPENTQYSWQPTIGLSDPNSSNPEASPLETTIYTVTITPSDCASYTDSVEVIVNPLTVNAYSTSFQCGDSSQLSVSLNFVSSNYSYSWSPLYGLDNPNIENPKASPLSNTQYTVTVYSNNGCDNPQSATLVSPTSLPPQEICMVSIRDNKNLVLWDKPISNIIDTFNIWRETDITGVYENIGSISYADSSLFVDVNSNPFVQSNKYKISIKDLCALESDKSLTAHKTMHLSINQGTGSTWNLIWESYEGFTVSTYKIYRGTHPDSLGLIGTTSGSASQYSDNTAPTGNIYYQLQVVSPNSCNPSKSYNISYSNIASNNPAFGIIETNSHKNLHVYPNPVSDELVIEIIGNNRCINIEILNDIGQSVYKDKVKDKIVIQTANFKPGIYVIKFEEGNTVGFKKIIKK